MSDPRLPLTCPLPPPALPPSTPATPPFTVRREHSPLPSPGVCQDGNKWLQGPLSVMGVTPTRLPGFSHCELPAG